MKKLLLLAYLCFVSCAVFALSTLGNAGGTTAAATICLPGTKVNIAEFTIAQTVANSTLNTVTFTTTGTYAATDLTDFKLYANITNNFATAVQIGTTITTTLGPGSHSFAGLGIPLPSGQTGYLWITADLPATATPCNTLTVSAFTTANITVASGGAAGSTAVSGTQTINKTPVITASAAPTPLCVGSNLTLTGTGVACNAYSWAGPGGYTSAVLAPPSFTVASTNAGVYTLTATNTCGTSTATTASVVVDAGPTGVTATASPNPVCLGSNLTLTSTATGATSFQWIGPGGSGYSAAVQNPPAFASTVGDAGAFTFIARDATGCADTVTTAAVVINTQPTGVTASAAPNPVCLGNNLTLTGTGTGGSSPVYTWTGPGIGSLSGLTPAAFAAAATNAGVYTLTAAVAGCANVTATTAAVVVSAAPTGVTATAAPNPVCLGSNLTLTGTATGAATYAWAGPAGSGYSSGVLNPPAFAATAADAGIYTLTATNAAGCSTTATTAAVVVNAQVTGLTATALPNPVCVGANLTLTGTATGGSSPTYTWTGPGIGSLSGLTPAAFAAAATNAGIYTLTAVVAGCANSTATTASVVVNAGPTGVTATATPLALCAGSNLTLTGTATGATTYSWAGPAGSGYSSALLNPAPFVTTAADAGVYTLTATSASGCSSSATTGAVTITASPGAISGSLGICIGATSPLSDAVGGGAWTMSNATVASISPLGVVTGIAAGTDTVTYTLGTCSATAVVTVAATAFSGIISGPTKICIGSTGTLVDAAAGGRWSASNGSGTVDSITGIVTGVSNGIDTITYLVNNACGLSLTNYTDTISAPANAGFIVGPTSVCAGTFALLTDTATGGKWSVSNGTGTIDSTGLFSALSVGVDTIYYGDTTSCSSASTFKVITINPLPDTGVISGPSVVCIGTPATMTESVSGGTWGTTNGNASISAGGVVTGLFGGMDTVTYSMTSGCGTRHASYPISVNPANAGTITGPTQVCQGSIITLSDVVPGGTFSSGNTNATITGAGALTGVLPGTDTITYTSITVCGTFSTTTVVTVNPLPSVGPISGPATVCDGATITLSDSTSGGLWSSGSTTTATVDSVSGVVTGHLGGTTSIYYTVTSAFGCMAQASYAITVSPAPAVSPITGITNECLGASSMLSDATAGGVWSSSSATIASIDTTGIVTGLSQGIVTISYGYTNGIGCTGYATAYDTVNVAPMSTPILGSANICIGSSVTFTDSTLYGTWSSSDVAVATVGSASGVVTGLSIGNTEIYYNVTNACGSITDSIAIAVSNGPSVAPISGPSGNICSNASILLSDATAGGSWSSSNTAIVTIATDGLATGVTDGTATITYSVSGTSGCVGYVTYAINFAGSLSAAVLPTGTQGLCHGASVYMHVMTSASGLSYQWYDNASAIAGATSYNYFASTSGSYGVEVANSVCTEWLTGPVVTPSSTPSVSFTAPDILYTGSYLTYQWMFNGALIPGANSSVYLATHNGSYNVIVTDGGGCNDTSANFVVNDISNGVRNVSSNSNISIYPNPATTTLHIDAPFDVNVEIWGMDGKLLMGGTAVKEVSLEGLSSGVYMIRVFDAQGVLIQTDKFTVIK